MNRIRFISIFLGILLFACICLADFSAVRVHAEALETEETDKEDETNTELSGSDETDMEDESADEPFRYEKLDEAFAADEVIFVLDDSDNLLDFDEIIITEGVIAAYGLDPDEVALAEEKAAALLEAALLNESQAVPAYVSPAGNSSLYYIEYTPAAAYEGTLRFLYPSEARGAEDTYGKLDNYYQQFSRVLRMGVPSWSHDGRYVVLSAFNLAIQMDCSFMDPTVIDLSTGEIFITNAFDNDIKSEGEVLCAACFSPDDRYLYYLMYGFYGDDRMALYRYEIETGVNERLTTTNLLIDVPFMYMNENEELFYPAASNPDPGFGLVCMKEEDGQWDAEFFGAENRFAGHKTFLYSDNSGYALQSTTILSNRSSCFQVFALIDGITGDEPYWAVRFSEDGETAELVEVDKEIAEFKGITPEELEEARNQMADLLPIHWAMLSPDGYYAFLYYGQVDGGRLVAVSLETMEVVLAKVEDESGIYTQVTVPVYGAYSTYLSPVTWVGDQIRVSIAQSDEVIRGQLK